MIRAVLSVLLAAVALVLGVWVAQLAAENRARAEDLDRRHHRTETLARQNELMAAENARLEWLVLRGEDPDAEDELANDASPSTRFEN